jgi:uncharacterized protein YndB with AHSA1/START domain
MNDTPLDIEHSVDIDASPEKVWKFLTDPAWVPQWLGCMRYDKAVGHLFYMQQDAAKREADDIEGATRCRILALDEARCFAFSWYLPDTPETEVHIVLESAGGGTRVTLTHTGWDKFDIDMIRPIRDALEGGWKSFVLPNLKRVAEAAG